MTLRRGIFLALLLALAVIIPAEALAVATMEKYCVQPPYVKRDIEPNILIIMDNSEINQGPAYKENAVDPFSGLPMYNMNSAYGGNPMSYSGLAHSTIWYSYDGTVFKPDVNGVFEGNLLNWATTSMYDLIQVVLLGGKSNSRQTNVNRLIGLNSGTWFKKIYLYTDTDGVFHACEIGVNENGRGELTIRDNVTYMSDSPAVNCGLVRTGAKKPSSAWRWISDASDYIPDAALYASSEPVNPGAVAEAFVEERNPLARVFFSAINTIISAFATEAEAKPVAIVSPNNGATLPDANLNSTYPNYYVSLSSGYDLADVTYSWSVSNIPTGMYRAPILPPAPYNQTNKAQQIVFGGMANSPADIGKRAMVIRVTETYTNPKNGSVSTTVASITVYLTVNNNQLTIKYPPNGQPMTDAIQNNGYGYTAIATGGKKPYLWSAAGLPVGLMINNGTGYISNKTSASPGVYNVTVSVSDADGKIANSVSSIQVRLSDLRIVDPVAGTKLTAAEKDKTYSYGLIATGGRGTYTWSTLVAGSLPPGLSIKNNAGVWTIDGTPTTVGDYSFTLKVDDGYDNRTANVTMSVKYDPVKITWPDGQYVIDKYGVLNSPLDVGDVICGKDYTNRFTPVASGGSGSYTWSVSSSFNTLLPDFQIDTTTGKMYGKTPLQWLPNSVTGIYEWRCPETSATITLSVKDNVTGATDSASVKMWNFGPGAIDPQDVTSGQLLPLAYPGKKYSGFSVGTWGGAGQNTWTIPPSSGTSEATLNTLGLYLDSKSGLIYGDVSPTATPKDYEIDLTVNGLSNVKLTKLKLRIVAPDAPIITWPSSGYETIAYVNEQITIRPTVVNGVTPYTYPAIANLPAGLSLNAADGTISGSIATAGLYNGITWTVKDARGLSSSIILKFNILARNALNIAYPAAGEVFNTAETQAVQIATFAAIGGQGPYIWNATGLPSGLSVSSDGLVSGTPAVGASTSSPYNVTVTVKDQKGATMTRSIVINVASALSLSIVSAQYNIQFCASIDPLKGDSYTLNCNGPTGEYKSGLLQDYWDQARFGLEDFNGQMNPNVTICPPANNASSFYTAVENATPVGVTKLVDGMYRAEQAYRGDLPANVGSNCDPFTASGSDPEPPLCTNNYILVLTSGEGANNPNPAPPALVFGTNDNNGTFPAGGSAAAFPTAECTLATYNMSKNACYGWEVDLRADKEGTQHVSTYVVNAMGKNTTNNNILKNVADVSNGNYYYADNPSQLKDKIKQAFKDILKRAASGTAASVLASGEGQGANLIQAVYYPARKFRNSTTGVTEEIGWLGRLSNFWFFVDPYFSSSSIHEETVKDNQLVLTQDYIVELYFDTTTEVVRAARYPDTDGDGDADSATSVPGPDGLDLEFEFVGNIWEAGLELWKRDLNADPRRLLVNLTNTPGAALTPFSINAASNMTMQYNLQATNSVDAERIIRYVNGEDITGFRSRTVVVDINGDGDTDDAGESPARVWKLGDVLNSTPRIASWLPINDYGSVYEDISYPDYNYQNKVAQKGMVFTGSNDGMMHAFKLGYLDLDNIVDPVKAKLTLGATTDSLGREMWAFIPKNALPYLRYQMENTYCHVFTVDQSPYIVDVSMARPASCTTGDTEECTRDLDVWRTVLIGGMRFGGGCKPSTTVCSAANSTDTNLDGFVDADDCINSPLPDNGLSSYFALDITEENNPKFLWEFTHPQLGASSTGPAIMRMNTKDSATGDDVLLTNGYWYVVFGSGPTGPTNFDSAKAKENQGFQYMGNSDQNLRLFVLDLPTGNLRRVIDTGIQYGYAGSMIDASLDYNLHDNYTDDYEDDSLYFGYTNKCLSSGVAPVNCTLNEWNDGGILRLVNYSDPDPANWLVSKVVDHIGPVTAAVATLNNGDDVWLYVGTGRYNFMVNAEEISTGSATDPATNARYPDKDALADDPNVRRRIMGMKDPCFDVGYTPACTSAVDNAKVTDVTLIGSGVDTTTLEGWYLTLDPSDPSENLFAEREITDPVASPTTELVYFTTLQPYADKCSFGGKSYIWAIKYDTGGAPGAAAKGTALIQVSTGSIEKMDLSEAFDNPDSKGGRRSAAIEGIPPLAKGLGLSVPPAAVDRMLYTIEGGCGLK